jgi:hypothetical protein
MLMTVASVASGQSAAPISLEVRSTGTGVYNVSVTNSGTRFGLAVYNGAPGSVTFDGKRGIGTTPTIVTVDTKPGWVRIAVSANEPPIRVSVMNDTTRKDLIAVGRSIDAVRDTLGNLTLIPTQPRP